MKQTTSPFSIPDLPESRDVCDVVVRFFDKHLGK
jgi:hypothetical protein